MTEIDRIVDQMERAFGGDPWYGPSLADVLDGVTSEQANHRPIADAHTVWEIVLHLATWTREVARRVRDGIAREPEDADWPAVPAPPTEAAWRESRAALERACRELADAARAFPPERLDEVLGDERDRPLGSGVSFYVLLHGAVQHTLAHTAQMSLLRKALT